MQSTIPAPDNQAKAAEKARQLEFKKDQRMAHFKVGYVPNGDASVPKPPSMLAASGAQQVSKPSFAGGPMGNQFKPNDVAARQAMIDKNRASNIVYAGGKAQTGYGPQKTSQQASYRWIQPTQ